MLGVHPNTIRAWSRQGVLPCLRINGRGDRRYRREDLAGFMNGATVSSETDERRRRADLLLHEGGADTVNGNEDADVILGGVLGGLIFRSRDGRFHPGGWIMSIIGALVVLWVYITYLR